MKRQKAIKKSLSVFCGLIRFTSMIAYSAILLSVLAHAASAAENNGSCGDNVIWSFIADTGVLNISGMGKIKNYDFSSPWNSYK